MTEPIPLSEVPDDIGRNDRCPCGSGKKYKKCCMRAHQVQKEATKASVEPHEIIGAESSPWDVFKVLAQVRENNMPNLFWELAHGAGPWRQTYPTKASYFEALGSGTDNMVARDGYELTRIRHDGDDVLLLICRGVNDPHTSTIDVDLVTLRPNEMDGDGEARDVEHAGWRIWNVERSALKKSEVDGELRFEDVGCEWRG